MEPQLNEEVAKTAGAHDGPIETDAVIVGAGPVGLFQVFELGLLEIKAHIIDSLAYPGGQCIELYPDKPIYDIPAVPVCTGKELTDNLLKQIEPFGATFHLGQEVSRGAEARRRPLRRRDLARARASSPRRSSSPAASARSSRALLKVDGLDKYDGTQLHLPRAQPGAVRRQEPRHRRRRRLGARLGAELRAGRPEPGRERDPDAPPRRLPRRAGQRGARCSELCDAYEMQFVVGQVTGIEEADGRLTGVKVTGSDGVTRVRAARHAAGVLRPEPEARARSPTGAWRIERKQIVVDTEKFETSVPGIFAVGDINTYPGKKKLILSGFHEAALAAFGAAPYIFPDKRIHLQYTTTSPKLHKVLGVETPVFRRLIASL